MDKFTNGLKSLLSDKKLLVTVLVHVGLSFLFFLSMFFPFFRLDGGTLAQSFAIGDYTVGWLYVIVWILALVGYPVLIVLGMKQIAWYVLLGQAAFAVLIFILGVLSFFTAQAYYNVFHLAFGFFLEPIFIAGMVIAALLEKTVMDIVFKLFKI
jgi:hypothetical protein